MIEKLETQTDKATQDLLDKTRRNKTTTIYEAKEKLVDANTGEILSEQNYTYKKTSTEPDFIKVYYKTILAFSDIEGLPVSFLLALSEYIPYTNDGERMIIQLSKLVKEQMQKKMGVSSSQLNRYIKIAKDTSLLVAVDGYRGAFEVNPCMIARGKWESIKDLQADFVFRNGGISSKMIMRANINRQTEAEVQQ